MADPIDIKLIAQDDGAYDLEIDDNGDFVLDDGFDTSLVMSLLCDARATADEVPATERRRGWIGDELADVLGDTWGSKLWLYEQSRLTVNTLNGVSDAASDALVWMTEDGIATGVEADAIRATTGALRLSVTLLRSQSRSESRFFDIWEQTGR